MSIAELAAQAAQKALDCGPLEAGPEAARRAAEAGARALKACQGLSSLGGLADVVAQLRHSVHLPLQVGQPCMSACESHVGRSTFWHEMGSGCLCAKDGDKTAVISALKLTWA